MGEEFIVIFRLLLAAVLLDVGAFPALDKECIVGERVTTWTHHAHPAANKIQSDVSFYPEGLNMIKIL